MSDKLVFDLSQEVEGTPNVFVRKDWVNILDNQNQNYNNNQSIIDTSQLSNSNKYMSYREAYLSCPFLLTLGNTATPSITAQTAATTSINLIRCGTTGTAASTTTSLDHSIGLKNWFGQIIHSFTLEYNGTTICQQTPFINMWNSFKLLTSLSLNDVSTQGATIGFFPDDPTTWGFFYPDSAVNSGNRVVGSTIDINDTFSGQGTVNNTNFVQVPTTIFAQHNSFNSMCGNEGFLLRQRLINYNPDAFSSFSGPSTRTSDLGSNNTAYSSLLSASKTTDLWKSYLSSKRADSISCSTSTITVTSLGYIQYSIVGAIYLKHIHSFFNMCPLLKGVFMKLTLNLNNSSSTIKCAQVQAGAGAFLPAGMQCSAVSNAVGGVNPIMIASACTSNGSAPLISSVATSTAAGQITYTLTANLSVGATCLDQTLTSVTGGTGSGLLSKSIYLYVPAMTFNPTFEQAYLSNSVKQIKYTDVYQYQILNVAANGLMNNLVTNGISNIKSVLILPFFSSTTADSGTVFTNRFGVLNSTNTGFIKGVPVFQSPFDTAGTGTTSPLSHLTQFNVQISGQNAIYNTQRYIWEEFNHQLYGQNAVNGGLTDGITSSLIDRQAFDLNYCYYYVNVERMLPVEMSVPKSVQILGTNVSSKAMDYFVFVEYGVEIQIDALTGARV